VPQTVVLADVLGVGAVVEGLRAGRSWLAESSEVGLELEVSSPAGSATCGGRLAAGPADLLTVRLRATGVPGCVATLMGPAGPCGSARADGAGTVVVEQSLPASALRFVRAEVRRPASSAEDVPADPTSDSVATAMVAMTNPVFVDVD
jgi:hypothetical protein